MARRAKRRVGPFTEPAEAARAASLRYVSDGAPGIRRRRSGTGFTYQGPDGQTIRDKATLARIRSLVIPPAWTGVWICPGADCHLQATGRDARGRKQYRYHPRWVQARDETKYGRMAAFGHALPRIRRRVQRDLAREGLPRERVIATIVRLLENTLIRVGNEEYAKANNSFGLTTLRNRHVEVQGATIRFRFRGKSGKEHEVEVNDRRLATLVRQLRDLPGQDLFQYLDDAGEPRNIDSGDVNAYLQGIAGEEFTAKDFRTWAGTLFASRGLVEAGCAESDTAGKSAVAAVASRVAKQLANTPAVCRKCYIHPAVLEAYRRQPLFDLWMKSRKGTAGETGLSADERALLRYLEACSQLLKAAAA